MGGNMDLYLPKTSTLDQAVPDMPAFCAPAPLGKTETLG
jgi:hypothetical protein